MLELIVSIVVIGLAFATVPTIILQTSENIYESIQQEAIMAGMTNSVNVMSYRWDENQTDETINAGYARALDNPGNLNTSPLFSCLQDQGIRKRRGHFRGTYRRRCYATPTQVSTLGFDAGDGGLPDDLDDLNAIASNINAAAHDYKQNYTVTIRVGFIPDNFMNYDDTDLEGNISTATVADRTNLKLVETNVSSPQGDVLLYALTPNIGEYKIYHRSAL